ncbi:hypothetical protein MOV08_20190 [Streptomyces yunnanensis]|uniref:Uncharacterized protein n=1 Tax=Streptomyces yunnanensis TaxID=156453 RepID=A0ABY8A8S9_9ACTN|nr:hypothetical protein [Streptomyces yunnanensis]WEB41363.1 hypothetical protein MOV08_20190 [Streptomyces yunnanensis]
MSDTTVRLDSLPEAAVALLRAVYDALDIPLPDTTAADQRAYDTLLHRRSVDARVILDGVLHEDHMVGLAAEVLREWTARRPVTYTPWTDDGGAS